MSVLKQVLKIQLHFTFKPSPTPSKKKFYHPNVMEAFKFISMLFLFVTLLLIIFGSCFCCADINVDSGKQCSRSDGSTAENNFQTNLKNLLDSLTQNGPLLNGFYTTSAGDRSDQIFGLVQCRGDISPDKCGSCIKNSSDFALSDCPESREVVLWFTWCFLRYSTENFIGVLGLTSVALANDTNYDDPSVVSNGLSLMSGLASSAPNQRLMFQTAVLNAGQRGKRYGMAQCTRDISASDCAQCLNSQLETFRTTIGSKKDWEIYGFNCFMRYHDHQFYFNYSVSTSAGGRWLFAEGGRTICISTAVLMLLMIL